MSATPWSTTMRAYDARLRAYCRTTRCSPGELEEILADVWAEVVLLGTAFSQAGDQWLFLQGVARRICNARARQWRREVPLDDGARERIAATEPERDPWPNKDVAYREWWFAISALMPDRERIAVDLRVRYGWEYAFIAQVLGCTEQAARTAQSRGIARLRRLIRVMPLPPSPAAGM